MTIPLPPVPLPPRQLPDADLWEYYRARGLSPQDATIHVERRHLGKAGQAQAAVPEGPAGTTKGQAVLRNAAQAATSGFGDEIIAAMNAFSEPRSLGHAPGFDPGIFAQSKADLRQQVAQTRVEHPFVSLAGTVGGAMVNPLNKLLGPATAGLGGVARGAVTGGVLGGMQGLGEGTGTLKDRAPSAAVGAALGVLTGAALGKLTNKLWPTISKIGKNVRSAFGKAASPEDLMALTEAAVRKQLAGQPPEVVEQLLERLRQAGQVAPKPAPPPPPPTVRPGETIQPLGPFPIGPKALRTMTPDPLDIPTFQRGVGGHSYAGTFPAGMSAGPGRTVPSPVGGPLPQEAIQMQQLALLARLPEAEFRAAAKLFPAEVIQQLQGIRLQFGLGR